MANCQELCTAAKCQELEDRIIELEGLVNVLNEKIIDLEVGLDNLETGLDEHVTKPTGEAHEWDIYFDSIQFIHDTSPEWQDLLLAFEVLNGQGEYLTEFYQWSDTIPYVSRLEFDDHIEQGVSYAHDWDVYLDATISLSSDEQGNYLNYFFDLSNGEDYFSTVEESVGLPFVTLDTFQEHLDTPIPDAHAYTPTNDDINTWLNNLDFFFRIDDLPNNNYDFVITLGERTRSEILNLPSSSGGGGTGGTSGEETPLPPTNLSIDGSYDDINNDIIITVGINGKSASTIINLDAMPFDNIQNSLDAILNALTIELSGQYEVGKTDTTLLDVNGDKIIDYSKYIPLTIGQEGYVDTSYTDNGLVGLHQAIIALDKKITTVHKDLAKAVDPQVSLEVIAPTNCYENVSRNDYTDEEWALLPQNIRDEIEKDFGDRFRDFVLDNPVLSELFEPLLRTFGTLAFKIPNLPAFFALNFASNFLIHQLKDDHPIDCTYSKALPVETETETVTIVASPEVQANTKDDALVLDFTTSDAFPGLNETRSKWRVQIPAPIENITWDAVKNIRWFRGGLYGQIRFVGRKNSTSGWFRSKADGESYFSQIEALTTLETENISFSEHSSPKVSPAERETRVYRAFKVFVSENGEPNNELTQVFKPPVNTQ